METSRKIKLKTGFSGVGSRRRGGCHGNSIWPIRGSFRSRKQIRKTQQSPTCVLSPRRGRECSKTHRLGLASAPRAPSPALTVLAPKGNIWRLHLDSSCGCHFPGVQRLHSLRPGWGAGRSQPLAHCGLEREGVTQGPTRPTEQPGRRTHGESPCVRQTRNTHLVSRCRYTSAHTYMSCYSLKNSGDQAPQLGRCRLWELGRGLARLRAGGEMPGRLPGGSGIQAYLCRMSQPRGGGRRPKGP